MTPHALALALVLLYFGSAATARDEDARTRIRIGEAYDRSSGEMLYREIHEERWVRNRLTEDRVSYRRTDGAEFATKRVHYGAHPTAPEFELVNTASGHQEAMRYAGNAIEVRFRASAGEPERSATLPLLASAIADAGFDRFVEQHWDLLTGGETIVRPFLVPSRLGLVDMRIRRAGEVAAAHGRQVVFELAIDSALLRIVVPAVRVHYDLGTRALRRYVGVANLRGAHGRNLDVIIEFPPRAPD